LLKTAKNSNKKFKAAEFVLEYSMIYNEETGTISNSSEIDKAYKQYRLR
jgi:hypothetical protein